MNMDNNLTFFSDMLGGCERILRAPIPVSFTRHTDRFLIVWLTLVPLALYPECGWGVVPVSSGIAAVLCGIEASCAGSSSSSRGGMQPALVWTVLCCGCCAARCRGNASVRLPCTAQGVMHVACMHACSAAVPAEYIAPPPWLFWPTMMLWCSWRAQSLPSPHTQCNGRPCLTPQLPLPLPTPRVTHPTSAAVLAATSRRSASSARSPLGEPMMIRRCWAACASRKRWSSLIISHAVVQWTGSSSIDHPTPTTMTSRDHFSRSPRHPSTAPL